MTGFSKRKKQNEAADAAEKAARPKLADMKLGNVADLQRKKFDPLRWIVPDRLPEGLSLLVGKPKLGKSWMALDTALAVATGGKFLGRECQQGDVLGLFLEDNERRLQSRITSMIGAQKERWPERFQYATMTNNWPRLSDGGLDMMGEWIARTPEARLIVVDILENIRDRDQKKNRTQYEEDYSGLKPLHKLASETRVSIMVLHHQRKAMADDPMDTISGTGGLGGAVDTLLVLGKDNASKFLYGRGRDLDEFRELVKQDENCRWVSVGAGYEVRSEERGEIAAVLSRARRPMHLNEIRSKLPHRNPKSVKDLLSKMLAANEVERVSSGVYRLPEAQTAMDLDEGDHI